LEAKAPTNLKEIKHMKKNSKILMVLAIALVFTIAAGICAYQILSPQQTTIYVFNKTYTAGTKLTNDMLTPIQVDSKIVIAGANSPISNRFITQAEYPTVMRSNDSLKTDVGEGAPLVISLLSATGGNSIEMSMQSTAIAVTVDVTPITGITNDLAPGASVNVYVTYNTGSTKLILEKMRVLAVHKNGSGGSLSGVTLELTNTEAVYLIDAVKNGSIYLGLVNAGGYQMSDQSKSSVQQTPKSNVDDVLPTAPK
jgi:Flp pilus assembly protein CpaB